MERFRNGGERVALLDGIPHAGDRENGQGLAYLERLAALQVIRPQDRIHRHIKHLSDMGEGIPLTHDIDTDGRILRTDNISPGPGRPFLRQERGFIYDGHVAAAQTPLLIPRCHGGAQQRHRLGIRYSGNEERGMERLRLDIRVPQTRKKALLSEKFGWHDRPRNRDERYEGRDCLAA